MEQVSAAGAEASGICRKQKKAEQKERMERDDSYFY